MKKKHKFIKLGLVLAVLFAFLWTQEANAVTVTWTGATDNDWNTAGNWDVAVPTNADDVIIITGATVTMSGAGVCQSLTINGTGTLTTGANTLTIGAATAGNLTLNNTSVLNASGSAGLTCGGAALVSNVAVNNTAALNLTGATVSISGTFTAAGTVTTTAATKLTLNGVTAVTLPTGITTLGTLTVNGNAKVVKLGATMTSLGDAGGPGANDLVITNGNLDLNGFNITLNDNDAVISETAPNTIINTGTAGAYISTAAGCTAAEIAASGIGVTSITNVGVFQVSRYPSSSVTISTGITSVDRVYRVQSGTAPVAITLLTQNADINNTDITALSMYSSTALAMTSATDQGSANKTVTIGATTTTVAYSSINTAITTDHYLTLASADMPANTKVFTGAVSNNWSVAGNWNPAGVPVATDNVSVSSGKTLVVDAGAVCNDMTITDATASVAAAVTLDINGDLTLAGTSALTPANTTSSVVTFTGGVTQTITVSDDSYLSFGQLTVNGADVETADNFTVNNILTVTGAGDSFIASAGTATFSPIAAGSAAWVNGGTLTLFDVLLNTSTGVATPATDVTVTGNFTKIGTNTVTASAGTVTFTNTNPAGKELQVVGGATTFWALTVTTGSKLYTNSSFSLASTAANTINVAGTGLFEANAGTITFSGGTAASITAGASATLKFNDLTIGAATASASNFTVKGNFTGTAAFTASAGTVTFENNVSKNLVCTTAPTFVNLAIAANSTVVTTGTHNFSIAQAGSLVVNTGASFTQGAAGTITFAADANNKSITNSGTLTLGIISVGDAVQDVTTTSSFTVAGTGITLAGAANGRFFATTPSTITLTGNTILTAPSAARMKFHNLTTSGAAAVTVAAGDFVEFTGNLTVDGTSTFTPAADATCTFNGTIAQTIGGSSTDATAIDFGKLVVNKGSSPYDATETLTLGMSVAVVNTGALTLTEGVLNLGSYTLTQGGTITRTNGYIDGATGTYKISTGHTCAILTNTLFNSTLYNLTVGLAETVDGNLTINNDLDWSAAVALTIAAATTLELKGDLLQTAAGTLTPADAVTSILKLSGSGTCALLQSSLFSSVGSITLERAETLTGNLTFVATNVFTLNNSTNTLDLSTYTLTLNNTTVLNRVSGSIDASAGAVVFGTGHTTIPANLFTNNVVNNMTIAVATTLGSDLTINGTLTGAFDITTNNNTLTFGPSATLPAFVAATHVIGNLARTVTSTATVFPIGDGTANGFKPVALAFETATSSQVIKVSSQKVNPTLGKGGDPTRAINALWTITPSGTAPADNLAIDFGWGTDMDNGLAEGATTTFAARWNSNYWRDYRSDYSVTPSSVVQVALATSSIAPTAATYTVDADSVSGDWAVFVASANTTVAKDAAISVSNYKLAITAISPNPVEAGSPFTATVQLQDQYGNPVAATSSTLQMSFAGVIDGSTITVPVGSIPVGSSSANIAGFSYASAGTGQQFKATYTSGGFAAATTVQAGISEGINVMNTIPSEQVSVLTLTPSTTSVTLGYTLSAGTCIILAKAGSAITSDDFPVDGTTYFASSNYGQGSTINNAVVVYKGTTTATGITISGLAPNTTYYFRGFAYNGGNGNENYITFSSALNPLSTTTTGSTDDDASIGSNNTLATAKPIGNNTPVKGLVSTTTDEDWFSFSMTNGAPNTRLELNLGSITGNYNFEVYNTAGRRIRRGTRLSNSTEAQVINGLLPGTYIVRVFGVSGAYDASNYYTLTVKTNGSEIYSVTE